MLASQLQKSKIQVDFVDPPKIPIKNLKNPSFVITSSLSSFFKGSYDIVHAFNVPSAFAMKAARAKKRVLSIHGVFSDQVNALHSSTLSGIAGATEQNVLKWADALTTDSKASQKTYKEKLGLDFAYMPSPIDTTKFQDLGDVEKKEKQINKSLSHETLLHFQSAAASFHADDYVAVDDVHSVVHGFFGSHLHLERNRRSRR